MNPLRFAKIALPPLLLYGLLALPMAAMQQKASAHAVFRDFADVGGTGTASRNTADPYQGGIVQLNFKRVWGVSIIPQAFDVNWCEAKDNLPAEAPANERPGIPNPTDLSLSSGNYCKGNPAHPGKGLINVGSHHRKGSFHNHYTLTGLSNTHNKKFIIAWNYYNQNHHHTLIYLVTFGPNRKPGYGGPHDSNRNQTRSFRENPAPNTAIGGHVRSYSDPDGDVQHYTLAGADASKFTIGLTDAVIRTKDIVYDYDRGQRKYFVTVRVADRRNHWGNPDTRIDDTASVTISLTNYTGREIPSALRIDTGPANKSIRISWNKYTRETNKAPFAKYEVRVKEGSRFLPTKAITDINTTRHTYTGLTNGTRYAIWVEACNHDGCGGDPVGGGRAAVTPAAAGVAVNPTRLAVPESGNNVYTLVLANQPATAVTFAITRADNADTDLTVHPAQLIFTPSNWNTAQAVTVSAAADNDDARDGRAVFTHTATSGDSDYNGIAVASVTATEADNDFLFDRQTIADQTYTDGVEITPLTLPTATGGSGGTSYTLQPALPAGLSFDMNTRVLAGTPAIVAAAAYTYTALDASNATVNPVLIFRITVVSPLSFGEPTIADQIYTAGIPITPLTLPAAAGGSGEISYTLQPQPPAGLSYQMNTRVLSGTPTTATAAAAYTYTAVDASDDTANPALSFRIAVAPPLLTFGGQPIADQTYTAGIPITPLTLPAAAGGSGEISYTLQPQPPAGLSYEMNTRVLSGTPAAAKAAAAYTYTAVDASDDTANPALSFRITVVSPLSFGGPAAQTITNRIYAAGVTIAPQTLPAATGGGGDLSYTLQPALPEGLLFNDVTRVLAGKPVAVVPATTYTYAATDSIGNSDSLSFTITVEPALSIAAASVLEGDSGGTDLTFTVVLHEAVVAGLTVEYRDVAGTDTLAFPGEDYTVAGGILTFEPGERSGTIVVSVLGDTLFEGDETFRLAVNPAGGANPGTFVVGTIREDDTATFTLTVDGAGVAAVDVAEGEGVRFCVAGDAVVGVEDNLVVLRTADGTAMSGGDYAALMRPMEFLGSMRRPCATVRTLGDGEFEESESFTVELVANSGPHVDRVFINTPSSVTVTIINRPDFGGETVAGQSYVAGRAIAPLTLPAAGGGSGGSGGTSYTLMPAPPSGLSYDAATRMLAGEPVTVMPATTYTYTAMDAAGSSNSLNFTISVMLVAQPLSVTFTGVLERGETLTATVMPATPGNYATEYQWYRHTGTSASGIVITAATAMTYTLDIADLERYISVSVRYRLAGSGHATSETRSVIKATAVSGALTFLSGSIPDQMLVKDSMVVLTLPEARGGRGGKIYALTPTVSELIAGLSFTTETRVLSGTPTAAAESTAFTYSATDEAQDDITLPFTITVVANIRLRLRVFLEGPLR